MTIDCAIYRDGTRARTVEAGDEAQGIDAARSSLRTGEFLWIDSDDPTEGQIEAIGRALRLHPLAIEDLREAHQRPKIEHYGDYLLVCVHPVSYTDDAVETDEVMVCLGHDFVLTLGRGRPSVTRARAAVEEAPERLRHGPAAVLHAVLDRVVDDYDDAATELETDVEEVEASVFSALRTRDANRIYQLKRETLRFRRATLPLREPLVRLAREVEPREAAPYLRDVSDHLQRAIDAIESVDTLLDNALQAHLAQLSVQQNDDMRKLTAGAALFAIPTAIAGIYGMNFRHMPELHWMLGYPLALLAMVVACGYAYWRFKRSGWL